MEQSMFDTLLSLPLFQGLGQQDLTRILESTRLTFETVAEGTVFLRQDTPCTGLTFLMEGRVVEATTSADNRWKVEEFLKLPTVVGLDVLYGSMRSHRHSYVATAPTRLLYMDKRTVGALIAYFEVFRLNVLNLLTTAVVRRDQLHWLPPVMTLEGRITRFLRIHVRHPAGHKRFHISLRTLGAYLGEDPRYVSRALHRMSEAGLLKMERRTIEVPAFEQLINYNFKQ